ncbi:deoxyribose-phosphate aldolase [Lishizhenia tianjinensis]|uniref:Deoxyribose-phosphate aldolase n=1 Tax=Lishizhenia tianjinensis TaxID=477690 RepID=A0A1I7AZ37_9FLAO|nr:deoxyribose-phosphate aldolase [Lishizhenia tianjinensis]SFT80185.1 deoxyribose-phosphate aldolase [Lishizhenia tianjinensis]
MVQKAQEILSYLDYTSLSLTDNKKSITKFITPLLPLLSRGYEIAGVCVYPTQIDVVNKLLKAYRLQRVVVGCGFPDSQLLLSTKINDASALNQLEIDEVDIVLNMGLFKAGKLDMLFDELVAIRAQLPLKKLKVILETAVLSKKEIQQATEIAIRGGADFIKTSTGKNGGATPEAVAQIAGVVHEHFESTGQKVGIKVSGGVRTLDQAWEIRNIVKEVCGETYMHPSLFRIGASSLLNDLLKYIEQ